MSKQSYVMRHKEAFCVMQYQCRKCKTIVTIWNSRDGVTPFTCECVVRGCNGTMCHTNWDQDLFHPLYVEKPGTFVWADFRCDEERAKKLATDRIDAFKGTEFYVRPGAEDYDKLTKTLMAEFTNAAANGQPELFVIDDKGNKVSFSEV